MHALASTFTGSSAGRVLRLLCVGNLAGVWAQTCGLAYLSGESAHHFLLSLYSTLFFVVGLLGLSLEFLSGMHWPPRAIFASLWISFRVWAS
jgi:hypothetical protein